MNNIRQKKTLLVSNDDGYRSHFLRALVEALCESFEVFVVAPKDEQSWVGRAMSRSGILEAEALSDWPCEAWSVSGRPADCVNIGLHHLLPKRPDAVVSGMNLGFNVTLPLTLGSGTVAAATEGALAGLPAIAFSLAIPREEFSSVSKAHGHRDETGQRLTKIAAQHAKLITENLLENTHEPFTVHNVNFPAEIREDSALCQTEMTISEMPGLFRALDQMDHESTKRFTFEFASEWKHTYKPVNADIEALKRGEISHTILRWNRLGKQEL